MSVSPALLHTALLCVIGLAAVLYLASAVYPRLGWELTKWRYRDPSAVEPSRVVFGFRRARSIVLFCVLLAAGVALADGRDAFVAALELLSGR